MNTVDQFPWACPICYGRFSQQDSIVSQFFCPNCGDLEIALFYRPRSESKPARGQPSRARRAFLMLLCIAVAIGNYAVAFDASSWPLRIFCFAIGTLAAWIFLNTAMESTDENPSQSLFRPGSGFARYPASSSPGKHECAKSLTETTRPDHEHPDSRFCRRRTGP